MTSTEDNTDEQMQSSYVVIQDSINHLHYNFLAGSFRLQLVQKHHRLRSKSRYSLVHTNSTDFNTALNANSRCDLDLIQ